MKYLLLFLLISCYHPPETITVDAIVIEILSCGEGYCRIKAKDIGGDIHEVVRYLPYVGMKIQIVLLKGEK